MRTHVVKMLVAVTTLAPVGLMAQSAKTVAAVEAIGMTPVGTFASVSPAAVGMGSASRLGVVYGHQTGYNAYGVNGDLGTRFGTFRATVGLAKTDGFSNKLYTGSVGLASELASVRLNDQVKATLGGSADVGYGRMNSVANSTVWSGGIAAPLSLTLRSENVAVSPYFTPGFYAGRAYVANSYQTGTRFTLGGGVQVGLLDRYSLEGGVQHIMLTGAKSLYGAGFGYRF